MCKSLEQTAQSVQMNNLVHTCETSAGCTGVRCLISALGQTGYVETIILPCQQAFCGGRELHACIQAGLLSDRISQLKYPGQFDPLRRDYYSQGLFHGYSCEFKKLILCNHFRNRKYVYFLLLKPVAVLLRVFYMEKFHFLGRYYSLLVLNLICGFACFQFASFLGDFSQQLKQNC